MSQMVSVPRDALKIIVQLADAEFNNTNSWLEAYCLGTSRENEREALCTIKAALEQSERPTN